MVLSLSTSAIADANIGSVSEFTGTSEVVRKDEKFVTEDKLPIQQMDKVQTGNGRVEITFIDDSTVKVTEHSKLVIDDFVYTGKPNTSKMALKFAAGTVRFATGQKGIIDKNNIDINTPTATIAVRGTDFATTVDDFGKSLVVLLPEEDGTVGKIIVSNGAGSVTLTKAFEATMVTTADSSPSKPVVLNLSLNMIDNMMIVAPPEEVAKKTENIDKKANLLDLSDLDIDYLKDNEIEKDFLKETSLDDTSLKAEYLEDFLSEQNTDVSDSREGVNIQGTRFGMDKATQIYTYIDLNKLNVVRSVDSHVAITINKDAGVNIIIDQNAISNIVKVNDGGSNIIVRQSN